MAEPTERTVVLIPADYHDGQSEWFHNFVLRVTDALKRDGLDVRIVVAAEDKPR